MLRFTIRDLLWLMVVVALSVALIVSRREWYQVYVNGLLLEHDLTKEQWKVEYLEKKLELANEYRTNQD